MAMLESYVAEGRVRAPGLEGVGSRWQQHRSQLHRLDMAHAALNRHAKGVPVAIAVNAHQDVIPARPFTRGLNTEERVLAETPNPERVHVATIADGAELAGRQLSGVAQPREALHACRAIHQAYLDRRFDAGRAIEPLDGIGAGREKEAEVQR